MELSVITKEIYEASKRLEKGSSQLFTLAKEKAEAEREYRKSLGIEIMNLRGDKLQATLIGDVARGNMADNKYTRDLADARYSMGRDSIRAIETQISALQTIIKYQSDL